MFELVVEEKFDAAHCLRGYQGNCEKLHGHTYRVQAFLRTATLDELGMAADFREIRAALRATIAHLDHNYLNELPEFSEQNPTAEHIAQFIFIGMTEKFARLLHRVTVWETESSAATYWEEE